MIWWFLIVTVSTFSGAVAFQMRDDPVAFKNTTFDKCQKLWNVPDGKLTLRIQTLKFNWKDAMRDLYLIQSVEGLRNHKCVVECIYKDYEIYQDDGTINKAKVVQAISDLFANDTVAKDGMIRVSMECIDTVAPDFDPCEYNFDLCYCFVQGLKQDMILPYPEHAV